MSKYRLGVNFKWEAFGDRNAIITRSDFNELQNILSNISNDKFEFIYTNNSLPMDHIDIVPDTVNVSKEERLREISKKIQNLQNEINCIRRGD